MPAYAGMTRVWWRLIPRPPKGTLGRPGFGPRGGGIAEEGAILRITRISLALAGVAALCLVALSAMDGSAGAFSLFGNMPDPAPIATPVKIYKDCQAISFCNGCRTVYKCRSCNYRKVCSHGACEWRDICVWGPYVKVLPRGARIIRVR